MSKKHAEKVFDPEEIEKILSDSLPNWKFSRGSITREFKTNGWRVTLMLINAVGHLSEVAWHHPELIATYDSLEIRLNTHDAGGITDRDFALAEKIEEFVNWQPQATGDKRLPGNPEDFRYRYIIR